MRVQVRGLAHRGHWQGPLGPFFERFGAVRASPLAAYRLLSQGEAVLLYPGGGKEVGLPITAVSSPCLHHRLRKYGLTSTAATFTVDLMQLCDRCMAPPTRPCFLRWYGQMSVTRSSAG